MMVWLHNIFKTKLQLQHPCCCKCIRQKDFICKTCHKELKDGNYTNNIQNCPNYDKFGSDRNHDQHTQDNVEQSRIHATNNIMWF